MAPESTTPLQRRVRWEPTGETTWPLRADVDGKRWRIRLGDFPAESAYTLVIDDADIEAFDDWPSAWHDPSRAKIRPDQGDGPSSLDGDVRKRHAQWLGRDKKGTGRLSALARDLSGQRARGSIIPGARFDRSTLDRVDLSYANVSDAELIDCSALAINLARAELERTVFERVRMAGADLRLAVMLAARLGDCDLSAAWLDRARLNGVVAEGVSFTGALVFDATLNQARFVDCDFQGADLSRVDMFLELCTTFGTRFERCDFRGANFTGRRLKDTVFERCKLAGVVGKPAIEGPFTVTACDLSQAEVDGLWK